MNKLASQESILEYIDFLKSKKVVTIIELEQYYKMLTQIERSIEQLRDSRDNWHKKFKELEMKCIKGLYAKT